MTTVIESYVRATCKMGQGAECCRYLMMGPQGWECGKIDARAKAMIDQRVAAGKYTSQGDNCDGKGLS